MWTVRQKGSCRELRGGNRVIGSRGEHRGAEGTHTATSGAEEIHTAQATLTHAGTLTDVEAHADPDVALRHRQTAPAHPPQSETIITHAYPLLQPPYPLSPPLRQKPLVQHLKDCEVFLPPDRLPEGDKHVVVVHYHMHQAVKQTSCVLRV